MTAGRPGPAYVCRDTWNWHPRRRRPHLRLLQIWVLRPFATTGLTHSCRLASGIDNRRYAADYNEEKEIGPRQHDPPADQRHRPDIVNEQRRCNLVLNARHVSARGNSSPRTHSFTLCFRYSSAHCRLLHIRYRLAFGGDPAIRRPTRRQRRNRPGPNGFADRFPAYPTYASTRSAGNYQGTILALFRPRRHPLNSHQRATRPTRSYRGLQDRADDRPGVVSTAASISPSTESRQSIGRIRELCFLNI